MFAAVAARWGGRSVGAGVSQERPDPARYEREFKIVVGGVFDSYRLFDITGT